MIIKEKGSLLYLMAVALPTTAFFILSPSPYNILSPLMLYLLLLANRHIYSAKGYACAIPALLLHHIMLFAIEHYETLSPENIMPLIWLSGLIYAPVIPNFFICILAAFSFTYHYWTYCIIFSPIDICGKTLVTLLVAAWAFQGVRFLRSLAQEKEHCRQATIIDSLTKLYDFPYILREGQRSLEQGKALTVAVFAIDNFTKINDTFGYAAGNAVLQHFALTLKHAAGEHAVVGRLGGDQFILLINHDAALLPDIVSKTSSRIPYTDYIHLKTDISYSCGSAVSSPASKSIEVLIALADKEMRCHKKAKKSIIS